MIVMEGLMLVPPERGTIIGRALWKVGAHDIPSSKSTLLNYLSAASICSPRQRGTSKNPKRHPIWYGCSAQWAQRSKTDILETKSR